jgi:ElaB/YqjD/DUF883 family membrane-anchored ribosome-binding protein
MTESRLEEDFEQVRSDLRSLREDVRELALQMRESGSERISRSLDAQRERLRQQAGAVRDRGRKYTEELEEQITGHPQSSLAIAFGAGFIAAKLLDGGRH